MITTMLRPITTLGLTGILKQAQQCMHTSSSALALTIWERHRKGGYEKESDKKPHEHVKTGMGMLKDEFKLFQQEVVDKFKCDKADLFLGYDHMEFRKVWMFNDKDNVDKWTVTADSDNNEGRSVANFELNENKKGYFHGNIDRTVPKTGDLKYAGYCNIKSPRNMMSFQRPDYYDFKGFTHLMIRARGDGRTYILNLGIDSFYDVTWNNIFQFALYTHGGPYWQVAKIPFSKFFHSSKGRIQDRQEPLTELLEDVTYMSVTAMGEPGDFGLELDFIGVYHDQYHTEKFAYELYQTDKGVAGT